MMNHSTRPLFCFWLPFAIGLAAVCGLLLAVSPTAVASPPKEQPTDAVVLWLVPPETSPAPDSWPLAVEAHQAGWQVQSVVVEERLAALKAQGHIGDFEPLSGGVGFTVTTSAGLPPEVCRWIEVARVTPLDEVTPEALAAWWQEGLDTAGAERPALLSTQQVTTLTLNLGLHSRLISGSAPQLESIALSLIRDDEVIASSTAMPFPGVSGVYLYAATLYETHCGGIGGGGGGGCYCFTIQSGDILQAVQSGQTVSLTVPLLTALADQNTAIVYGQAPVSATLEVYFYRYGNPSVAYQQTVTTTVAGDYQADFSSLTQAAPRDYGYVFHTNEADNHIYARYNVPFLWVEVESDHADGVVAPSTIVTATLHDDTGALRDSTYDCSSSDGAFSVHLYPGPEVGDTLVVTAAGQVVSMTVPALTARPDPSSDVISGEAPPGAAVQVDLYRGPLEYEYDVSGPPSGEPDHTLSITATLMGTYAADFTGLADVVAGDYGVVYVTNATGHQAYRHFAVPFLQARLGEYRLMGQVSGSQRVTVTVWGSSGVPRDVRSVHVYDNGYFDDYDWGNGLRLLAGDQVTVTAQDGGEMGLTLPLLTADADLASSTVHGQAPPNSSLRVGLSRAGYYLGGGGPPYYPSYEYTLWVTSTASGVYTADFSSLTMFQPGYQGAVFYVNPEGHEVYLEFVVPIVRVQSGGNYVAGVLPAGSDATITLRDVSGQVKATVPAWSYYAGSFEVYLYRDWQPVIIEAGDTVEVVVGETRITVTVPTLTVQADRATDVLSGQSPPNAPLEVIWYGGDEWDGESHTWIVSSTVAGTYILYLSGEVDLERGDRVEVVHTDGNGNQVWVARHLPRLEAALGDSLVSVFGPPYTPLTLTLLGVDGSPPYTTTTNVTTTLDESGNATPYLHDVSYAPVHLQPGQMLVADLAGEVMIVTLPHLTAQADPQADTVSGEAPPEARLMVSVNCWWDYWPVTATIAGTYSADFGGVVDIGTGSSGKVVYLHPDGHHVTLGYAVPHVAVTLGEPHVHGVVAGPGVVTVTLRDAGGGIKGSGVGTLWYDHSFYVYLTDAQQEMVSVAGGDVVIVETVGSVMTFIVPVLTASFDRETGILTGTAPVGAWLPVTLGGGSRQVQVGPDETYAMDWSDLSPRPGAHGSLEYTDDAANRTRLHFTVPYYNLYLPVVMRDG